MRIALIDPSLFTLPYDSALAAGLTQGGHDVTLYGRKPRPEEGSANGVRLTPAFYRATNTRLADKLPGALRAGSEGAGPRLVDERAQTPVPAAAPRCHPFSVASAAFAGRHDAGAFPRDRAAGADRARHKPVQR